MTTKEAPKPTIKTERDRVFVENYGKDTKDPVTVKPEIKETVYIGNCSGGQYKVETKCKGVTINKCENITIQLAPVVGNAEIMNCKKVTIYFGGAVPIIQVDGSERISLHIHKDAIDAKVRVYTAKSSSVNVYIPGAKEEDDETEVAIPEQVVSTINGKALSSEVVIPGKE
eukprot:TRINITY_DN3084_c0_g1_i3.p1 TRINITY_DN3084_c0_g1~~TRINITY_DN3084_c0_g1_i3.p1  ORF type:complete len:171 (+),score=36.17 TRINITY_DN3084_c0_g1_i3:43-555(+)